MYLFSRGRRILRNVDETLRIYGEILRLVNDNTGLEMYMWTAAFSPTPNAVVFTTAVNGRQDVLEGMQKLALVPEFGNLVEEMQPNVTPAVDAFRSVLNADSLDMDAAPKPVVNVMSAQIVGDLNKAFEWSLEMATYSGELTKSNVAVTVNTVGPMGQINWMAGVDTMGEVDSAEMALWSDPAYMERLSQARAEGYFGPGPGATGASVWMMAG